MTSGRPTYIYDPSQPFNAVHYNFQLKNGEILVGFGLPQPMFPIEPIQYFDTTGKRLHTEDIIAYELLNNGKNTHVDALPYGYDNRGKLGQMIKAADNPTWTFDFYVFQNMQRIIDALVFAAKLPAFEHLMDLSDIEPLKRNTYTIRQTFHDKLRELIDTLCDMRDDYALSCEDEYETKAFNIFNKDKHHA